MRLSHWLRSARTRLVPNGTECGRHPTRPPGRARLGVDPLEDRTVPSTFTVSTLADDGPGSLRVAVMAANANPGTDLIDFVPKLKGTVALTSGELGITDNVLIDGPGANRLAVSGSDLSRVFRIDAGAVVVMDGLTVTRGNAQFRGGGIRNDGTLTLSRAVVSDNVVVGLPGDLPAVNSFGGGIFNTGTLTALHTTFAGNRAIGADGVPGVAGSGALGGAIMSFGLAGAPAAATISRCAFVGNLAMAGDAAPGGATSNALGGGIVNVNGAMTISGSLFRDNQAIGGLGSGFGGGFAAGGAINNNARVGNATLVVSNCTLMNNRAIGGATATGTGGIGRGGGISNLVAFRAPSGPALSATVTVTGSTLFGNRAVGGAGPTGGLGLGGGLSNENGGVLTVANSAILLNRAYGGAGDGGDGGNGCGGGIFNGLPNEFGTPTLDLRGSLVALNGAAGGASDGGADGHGQGGGMCLAPGGIATADDATVVLFNHASTIGDDVLGILI
jgi:hypothetical protein